MRFMFIPFLLLWLFMSFVAFAFTGPCTRGYSGYEKFVSLEAVQEYAEEIKNAAAAQQADVERCELKIYGPADLSSQSFYLSYEVRLPSEGCSLLPERTEFPYGKALSYKSAWGCIIGIIAFSGFLCFGMWAGITNEEDQEGKPKTEER